MNRESYIRSSLAIAAAKHFTKSVRNAVFSAPDFAKKFSVSMDAAVNLGIEEATFQRSSLFTAIRNALSTEEGTAEALDLSSKAWTLQSSAQSDPPSIAISRDTLRIQDTFFCLLSPDKDVRLRAFQHEANVVRLPVDARCPWETLLGTTPLDDDEIGLLQEELRDTVVGAIAVIRASLDSGSMSLDSLVPSSARYYERLVGSISDNEALETYAEGSATASMRSSIEASRTEGYKAALLLAAHPSLSAALARIPMNCDEMLEIVSWATAHGDPQTKAALLEIGIPRLSREPTLQRPLLELALTLGSFAADDGIDQFRLLSSLFYIVYGELSHRQLLRAKPVFWRRLAAIAQASLVAREIISAHSDNLDDLSDWLINTRCQIFVLQCFVDMRTDPRWAPEFAVPGQMRNELIGRAVAAADANSRDVQSAALASELSADTEGSLRHSLDLRLAALPGPLEGNIPSSKEVPEALLDVIKAELMITEPTFSSFGRIANAALFFHINSNVGDLTASALQRAAYYLADAEPSTVGSQLYGLALAAASMRHSDLADAIFISIRKYRRLFSAELSVEEAFRIGMAASASRSDILEWAKCVGRFIEDLAFQETETEAVSRLHSNVYHLCRLVPELWTTCGHSEAALRSALGA